MSIQDQNKNQTSSLLATKHRFASVEIEKLRPGKWDPRHGEGDVADLVESFRGGEQHHNIVIRPIEGTDEFEIVTGHRRVRAAEEVGWTHIDAKIVEVDDEEAEIIAIQENLHRKDLSDAPKHAARLAALLQRRGRTKGDAVRDISQLMGTRKRTTERNIKLGTYGTPKLQEAHRHGLIGKAEADKLAGLPPEEQDTEIDRVVKERQERIAEETDDIDPVAAITIAIEHIKEAHRVLKPLMNNPPTAKVMDLLWAVHKPFYDFFYEDLANASAEKAEAEKEAARVAAGTVP